MEFSNSLIHWYLQNKRDLPWRNTTNPYSIWLSEIMLQQTRVEAVKPYYERFIAQLPNPKALAECEEDTLLKLWEGLGYYNRVRNMQKAAQVMVSSYDGKMPVHYEEIIALPGIGPYTAGAISSIAFSIPKAAVDGNVLRIISRIAEDDFDLLSDKTKKRVQQYLETYIPDKKAGDFNQALMELGATVCVADGKPLCERCPWQQMCFANLHQTFEQYPKKKKQKARRMEEKTVLLIADGNRIAITKRPSKGLLAGMYEFPNIKGYPEREEVLEYVRQLSLDPIYIEKLPDARHIFSHIEWLMKGYYIKVGDMSDMKLAGDVILIENTQIQKKYPLPAAFETYAQYVNIDLGI